MSPAVSNPLRPLRSVLRRCENAAVDQRAERRLAADVEARLSRDGRSRTIADQTLGGG